MTNKPEVTRAETWAVPALLVTLSENFENTVMVDPILHFKKAPMV